MECIRCKSEATPGKAMCESCMAIPRLILPPTPDSTRGIDKNSIIAGLVTLAILVLVVLGFWVSRMPTPLSGLTLKTNDGGKSGICLNKNGCLVVFLAPWCPSCREHVGFMNVITAAASKTKLGVEVVVGWDEEFRLKEFSQNLQGKVFLDSENKFKKQLGFSSVPKWFVVNSQQEVTSSFLPSYPESQPAIEQLRYIVADKAPELYQLLPEK